MDVLQHALAIAGRDDAQEGAAALVPGGGQIRDRETAADQRLLQLVAQQDMQMIGDLIGADPVDSRAQAVDRAME